MTRYPIVRLTYFFGIFFLCRVFVRKALTDGISLEEAVTDEISVRA